MCVCIPKLELGNERKELFDNFKGTDIITSSNGDLLVNGISFANIENIATQGNDILNGTSVNDKIIALGGDDEWYVEANNRNFKIKRKVV